jgi:hypothetical protein
MPGPTSYHYILNERREVEPALDLPDWAAWFETADRHVALTPVRKPPGKRVYTVSTVFLGIDHDFNFSEWQQVHQPILFETMIWFVDQRSRGRIDNWLDYQRRYRTYAEAEWGHWEVVKRFQTGRLYDEITPFRPPLWRAESGNK